MERFIDYLCDLSKAIVHCRCALRSGMREIFLQLQQSCVRGLWWHNCHDICSQPVQAARRHMQGIPVKFAGSNVSAHPMLAQLMHLGLLSNASMCCQINMIAWLSSSGASCVMQKGVTISQFSV